MTRKEQQELALLRNYFVATEEKRRIGLGTYKPMKTYDENASMYESLGVTQRQLAETIEKETSLLDHLKPSAA